MTTTQGPDAAIHELVFTGTAAVERGPLGRFLDLAHQIEAEGLEVPPEIADALDQLQHPKE